MPLQTSGIITLQDIRNEFGPSTPNLPVPISSYYKGGFYVRNTGVNVKVPTVGNQIKFSDFYGAVKYVGSVTIYVVAESASQYANSNNGYVQVVVNGNSPSFAVSCTARGTQTLVAGQVATFYSYDSSDSVIITVTDTSGTYTFGAYNIGYASGTQTYNFTL